MKSFVSIFTFLLAFGLSTAAYAVCEDSTAGSIEYTDGTGFQYCDGTNYVTMNGGGATGGECGDLGLSAGGMAFSSDDGTMVWCDGTSLIAVSAGTLDITDCAASGDLAAGGAGSMQYSSSSSALAICEGGDWLFVKESTDGDADAGKK